MTTPSAIAGVYADLRQVKSRGVWQLVLDIPAEKIEGVVKLFGMPRQDEPTWLGVAKLNLSPEASTTEPASNGVAAGASDAPPQNQSGAASGGPKTYTLANRIGMRCSEPDFIQWLARREGFLAGPPITGPDKWAAEVVRQACGVASRAEILPGTDAATRWSVLDTEYLLDTGQMAEAR